MWEQFWKLDFAHRMMVYIAIAMLVYIGFMVPALIYHFFTSPLRSIN